MSSTVNQRVAPNRVALILVLLLAVWLAFQFYPRSAKPAPSMAPMMAESKLHAVGLADNPDWAGLPELFAVWADKISWNKDTVRFAYWNPGSRSYSYFFEARRHVGSYRFSTLSPQELSNDDNAFYAEDGADATDVARRDSESPTHPFVFPRPLNRMPTNSLSKPLLPKGVPVYTKPKVPINLKPDSISIPPTEVKVP